VDAPSATKDSLAPTVRLFEAYLDCAVTRGASDLHFEPAFPDGRSLLVRMRVDGILHTLEPPPAALVAPLLARARAVASVELGQSRGPRDGRFRLRARSDLGGRCESRLHPGARR